SSPDAAEPSSSPPQPTATALHSAAPTAAPTTLALSICGPLVHSPGRTLGPLVLPTPKTLPVERGPGQHRSGPEVVHLLERRVGAPRREHQQLGLGIGVVVDRVALVARHPHG